MLRSKENQEKEIQEVIQENQARLQRLKDQLEREKQDKADYQSICQDLNHKVNALENKIQQL